ncbi:immunity repressor [Mycobacterium phage Apocalypse]|uniref:Immunity repressor n=1 Tax=Mycobacterium phage Apocalypse TaxID=2027890 RepID=A0A249XLS5_9CAUD|nr:transcriptional repressor [Mycobacterium phage Apocalypse]ASZ72673.1 immunity repressor [Mycobacterium phage Apocalypse]
MSDDANKSLAAALSYLVGRQLKLRELLEALQMSRSRYYNQVDEGRLITADNLIRAARNLEINEVDLLARYNLISDDAIREYAEGLAQGPTHPQTLRAVGQEVKEAPKKTRRRSTTRQVRADIPSL